MKNATFIIFSSLPLKIHPQSFGSNLNSQLKLFFYLLITTNNNLPLKIYYKNIFNISFLIKIWVVLTNTL